MVTCSGPSPRAFRCLGRWGSGNMYRFALCPSAMLYGANTAFQLQYFVRIPFPTPSSQAVILVTPTFGDPDLYVTVDGSVPSNQNYGYRSTSSTSCEG
jgi:hypothetical protein